MTPDTNPKKHKDHTSRYEDALRRASAICSKKEYSTGEIREKLAGWDLTGEIIERVIGKLKQERFLDDGRYAVSFALDKFRFNRWGRIKIAHMLRHKGIRNEEIRAALEQIDDGAYRQACLELLKQKSGSLKDTNHYTRKGKLYRFASGRGFEPELIHRLMDELDSA